MTTTLTENSHHNTANGTASSVGSTVGEVDNASGYGIVNSETGNENSEKSATPTATQRIKRATPIRVPRAISATVSVLDKVTPRLIAKKAAKLWWTPPTPKKKTTLEGGTVFIHGAIRGQTFGHGPLVYLVHGWGGYSGQLSMFVEPLVAAGYKVIAYDAPSHGQSQPGVFGKGTTTIYEMMDALAEIISVFGPAHAVIAHSLGGAVTAMQVAQGVPIGRAALICPPVDPIQFAEPFGKAFGLSPKGRERLIERIAKYAGHRNSQAEVVTHLERTSINLPPALIVSDKRDKEVDYHDGMGIAEAWTGATLRLSDGLGHRRILKDQHTVDAILDFVTAP